METGMYVAHRDKSGNKYFKLIIGAEVELLKNNHNMYGSCINT